MLFSKVEYLPWYFYQNVANISIKHKLYCIRRGCKSLTLSALVMWNIFHMSQIKVLMYFFSVGGGQCAGLCCMLGWERGGGDIKGEGKGEDGRGRRLFWRTLVGSNPGMGCCCCCSPSLGGLWYRKVNIVVFLFSVKFIVTKEYRKIFFLREGKEYTKLLVLKNVDWTLTKMRGFVHYASRKFLKYQIYIRVHSPFLVNYYIIL